MKGAKPYGRDPPQFASAKLIMKMTGGHCPCHDDRNPSFSAKPGREPGTTVVACGAGCSQSKLLAYFLKLGYRLGPMKMAAKRQRRPVIATTSIAWRALTPSERRMYEQIHASDDGLTYNDFVLEGISKSAVSVGLHALPRSASLASSVRRVARAASATNRIAIGLNAGGSTTNPTGCPSTPRT
jgi:hypothetical protein